MSGVEGPGVIGGGGGAPAWNEITGIPPNVLALGNNTPINYTSNFTSDVVTTNQLSANNVQATAVQTGSLQVAQATQNFGTGTQNNVSLGNNCGVLVITGSGVLTITGFDIADDTIPYSRQLIVVNERDAAITLANQNAGSSASNRLSLPGATNVTLGIGAGILLTYDTDINRWVTGAAVSGGAGSSTLVAFKPADTSRSNTTTFTDDPDLVFTGVAAGTYRYTAYLNVTCPNSTPDFKCALVSNNAVTAGTSNFQAVVYAQGDATPMGNSTNSMVVTSAASGQVVAPVSGGNAFGTTVLVTGTYVVGSTSNLSVQWTQAAADANATTLKRGSFMTLTPMT